MNGSDAPAVATLPPDAFRPFFTMDRQDGRDQVACMLDRDGWQAFEQPLPHCLFHTARTMPGLVVDIGANTGFYSLLAACASKDNHVLAFEPFPIILDMIGQNVDANRLGDRVRIDGCAISDRNGKSALHIPSQDHGLVETSASLNPEFKQGHSGSVGVVTRTLDRALFRPSLMMRRVSLIKIDVEGHEAAVLAGAAWTIRRHRPVIFIEILPAANFDAMNEFIRINRYTDLQLLAHQRPVVSRTVTFVETAWNHAFVPDEKVESFLAGIPD